MTLEELGIEKLFVDKEREGPRWDVREFIQWIFTYTILISFPLRPPLHASAGRLTGRFWLLGPAKCFTGRFPAPRN
jgi:hypothetical protein